MLGYWSVKWDDGDSSNYYIGKKDDESEATIRIDYCSWDSKCSDFKFTYSITQSTSTKFSYSEGWVQVRIFYLLSRLPILGTIMYYYYHVMVKINRYYFS